MSSKGASIIRNNTYIVDNSSLLIDIYNVLKFSNYLKIKIALFTKSGKMVERPKYYKVKYEQIKHWKLVR